MQALLYHGPRDIRYESFADPRLDGPSSAVVRVEACGICGSDLHIYHGQGFTSDTGYCVGHEAVGEVLEVGSAVRRFAPGDRVVVSGAVGCGYCPRCLSGRVDLCETAPGRCFGLSHDLEGAQAESLMVPAADSTLLAIPPGISLDQAIMLTDNLPTAYFGAKRADITPGQSVAVVGLGPVGLLAVECALVLGAARVFAIDLVPERLEAARGLGAEAVLAEEARALIYQQTKGSGVDAVIEAVGGDATIKLALSLARIGGVVSVVGVSQNMKFQFPMALAMVRSLTFRIGLCPIQSFWPELVPLVQAGRIRPERVITHRMTLAQGAEAYRVFDAREDGVMKVLLSPGG